MVRRSGPGDADMKRAVDWKLPPWAPWTLLGLGAVLAGFLLPQFRSVPAVVESPEGQAAPAVGTFKAQAKRDQPQPWVDPPDHTGMFLRLGVGTVLVLGLCVVTLRLGKKWLTGMQPPPGPDSKMRLVESLSLGNRCVMHLVHVGNRLVLVGTDASGLKTLAPLAQGFDETLLDNRGGTNLTWSEEPGDIAVLSGTVTPRV